MAKTTKLAALRANTAPGPTCPMISPASAGPTARAALTATPPRAAAERICARGTKS